MPTTNRILLFFCPLALAAMILSCQSNVVYDHYEHTRLSGWERNDTMTYRIPKVRTSGTYATEIGLRISPAFPFMSLTMIVERAIVPHTKFMTDTIVCNLIDKKGKPTGKGLNFFQYLFPLEDVHLNEGDSIYITVRHDMRMETLPGVSDIGIQLIKK